MDFLKKLFKPKQPKDSPAKFIQKIEGHSFYVLDAAPQHSINRFFHFITKSEQINTLGVPLNYFVAIADQLDVQSQGTKAKTEIPKLAELIRFGCQKEENKWYYMTIAIIESFVLIDDEPLDTMSETHNVLKRELMHSNPDVKFFFINLATEYLRKLDSSFQLLNCEELLMKNLIGIELLENITIQNQKENSN